MAKFTGNVSKYTHQELKDRHVSDFIPATREVGDKIDKWPLKKTTYTNEGVWNSFVALRNSFRGLLKRSDGFVEMRYAHMMAQIMMDSFLLRRAKGVDVQCPREVVPINAAPDDKAAGVEMETFDAEDFVDSGTVSANQMIQWVSENINKAGIEKKDAPSYGTYQMLLHYQANAARKEKFYDAIFPKLMTKEDADKGGKLVDDGKETIKLIDRLLEALPEAV